MVSKFCVAIASYICIIKIEGIDSQELHGTISLLGMYVYCDCLDKFIISFCLLYDVLI